MFHITRREVTLLLFCLTVYTFFYNFANPSSRAAHDASGGKTSNGVPPVRVSTANIPAGKLLGVQDAFREDGRRVEEYTDELELKILGDWEPDRRPVYDLGVAGATVNQNKLYWDGVTAMPQTSLLAHVSGLTILDNAYFYGGTLYIVTENTNTFPSPVSITSSSGGSGSSFPAPLEVRTISPSEAEFMGKWAMRMRGPTWLFAGDKLFGESHSLLSIYRAYSTLSDSKNATAPPHRAFFIHSKAVDWANLQFDTRMARLLFPIMNLFFGEDWKDLTDLHVPFYFERMVIADGASTFWKSSDPILYSVPSSDVGSKPAMQLTVEDQRLSMSRAFMLPAYPDWFSRLREGLIQAFGITDAQRAKAITFVSTQGRVHGPRLRQTDHAQLVAELQKLGNSNGWDVHIIELSDKTEDETPWKEQITAALQSSVMLSVHGKSLGYSIFMKPNLPVPTVMEFFPSNAFSNTNEFVARAMGMEYISWQDTRKYVAPSLPPIIDISEGGMQVIKLDITGIIRTIKEQMKRR